jgi:hypothetical protein
VSALVREYLGSLGEEGSAFERGRHLQSEGLRWCAGVESVSVICTGYLARLAANGRAWPPLLVRVVIPFLQMEQVNSHPGIGSCCPNASGPANKR